MSKFSLNQNRKIKVNWKSEINHLIRLALIWSILDHKLGKLSKRWPRISMSWFKINLLSPMRNQEWKAQAKKPKRPQKIFTRESDHF